jgi:predicted SnoaL-like aldol condensation-catalyzing enzyme
MALTAVAVTVALVPTLSASAEDARSHPGTPADTQTEANKALVLSFNDQLFNQGNLAVIDQYVAPTYTQHNPTLPDGPDALRQLVIRLRSQFPNLHLTTVRAVAQGDLVLLQNHGAGSPGQANFDLYRVREGKLVEHWDVLQTEVTTTASGNDMFAQLTKPAGNDAPVAVTAQDTAVVTNYLTALAQDHDLGAVDRYLAKSLVQHDPTLPNGSGAVKQAYTTLFAQNPLYNLAVAQVVAEGDLVAVHGHIRNKPSDLGQAVVYFYRVRGGKIVEEWTSVQNVPATSANANTMF